MIGETNKLTFIKAIESDYNEVISLFNKAANAMKEKGINHWRHWLQPPQNKLDQIKESIMVGEYYLIYINDQRIGMFRYLDTDFEYWGERTETAKYVHSLVIDPQFKGNRLGQLVLTKIEQMTKDLDVSILRLDCNSANHWLCAYYESKGFIKIGQVQMSWSLNNLYEKKL